MSGRGLIDRRWRSDSERHQAFAAAAVVLALAAVGLVALRTGSSHRAVHPPATTAVAPTATTQSTTTPPPAPAAPPSPTPPASHRTPSRAQVNRTQDTQNRDPRFRARLRRDLRERPAFQRLPYHADGVSIDLAGTTSDGRLVLSITYRGRLADARRAYRRFLARYHDPGRAYQPTYHPQP